MTADRAISDILTPDAVDATEFVYRDFDFWGQSQEAGLN